MGDGGDDNGRIEDSEGGGHQLTGNLAQERTPAAEIGRTVGESHIAHLAGRRGETEGLISSVALG